MFIDVDDVRSHGRDERIRTRDFYGGLEFYDRFVRALEREAQSSVLIAPYYRRFAKSPQLQAFVRGRGYETSRQKRAVMRNLLHTWPIARVQGALLYNAL